MDNNPFVIGAIAEDKNADAKYKILDIIENKITDYQGAIYKNQNTGELVAAHRGTEFNLGQGIQDAVIADGAMVIEAINAQVPDAMRLMERAKALAQMPENFVNGHPAPISTTGHSLGGTFAECMAYRYDVPGETFNAYGALGLHGVKEVASTQSVINHMRATDFVSAANGHYGEVRVYAKAEDIAALSMAGEVANRQGSAGFAYDIVKNVDAHTIGRVVLAG